MATPASVGRYDIEQSFATGALDDTDSAPELLDLDHLEEGKKLQHLHNMVQGQTRYIDERFSLLKERIVDLEQGMKKQVRETKYLAEALTQQGINLTVIRDNDALEAFKTLHVAQKLEKQVAESKLEIKMLQNFTGLHKHYAMLHEQEQKQLRKPLPPKPVQTTTRPAFHPGHHQKKSWFNRTASSALRVQGPSEDF